MQSTNRDSDTWADYVLHRRKEDPPELDPAPLEPPPVFDPRVPCPACGGSGYVEGHMVQLTKADAAEIGEPEAEGLWVAMRADRCEECYGDGWVYP